MRPSRFVSSSRSQLLFSSLSFWGFMWQRREVLQEELSWRFACPEPHTARPPMRAPKSTPFLALRFQAASVSGLFLDRTPLSASAPAAPPCIQQRPTTSRLPLLEPSSPVASTTLQSWSIPAVETPRSALPRRAARKRCKAQAREADLDWLDHSLLRSRIHGILAFGPWPGLRPGPGDRQPLSATRGRRHQRSVSSRFTYPLGASLVTLSFSLLLSFLPRPPLVPLLLESFFPPFRHPELPHVFLTKRPREQPESCLFFASRQLVALFSFFFVPG